MTLPEFYPPADHVTQWKPALAGGATFDRIEKVVLHSTETAGWPSYPSFAPHLTYNPWTREWRQHLPLTRSATTLADPSSTPVRENRDNVWQVEIIGYADEKQREDRWISKLPELALLDLATFLVFAHQRGGMPLQAYRLGDGRWRAYPASYGLVNPDRLSSAAYDAFQGVLGHQHVSGNDHGDPGRLDIGTIMRKAQSLVEPAAPVTPKPKPPRLLTYAVAVAPGKVLNGRAAPSTTAKIRHKRMRGFTLKIVRKSLTIRGGYEWGRTDFGTWYALRQVAGGKTVQVLARPKA